MDGLPMHASAPLRILYLATADARGHLMRAQLLAQALRAKGAAVDVLTTSEAGRTFLAGFGIDALVLSPHYAMQFDSCQNMRRRDSAANVLRYMLHPGRMLRDVWRLRAAFARSDLVVNDSFHPALLLMGYLPGWRHKVVHVYGGSLRRALEGTFDGSLPRWAAALFRAAVSAQIDASHARLEHDFAYAEPQLHPGRNYRLPTPVAIAPAQPAGLPCEAAVYLNPHFRDADLALALEQGLAPLAGWLHLVGEGYAGRPGWQARDAAWVDRAAQSRLIVSAPGMAALSVALVYRRPILLIVTEQPEQQANAARAANLGLAHRVVVWRGDAASFRLAVQTAAQALLAGTPAAKPALAAPPADGLAATGPAGAALLAEGIAAAEARVQAWVLTLMRLAQGRRLAQASASGQLRPAP
jgi:hypothetical protein